MFAAAIAVSSVAFTRSWFVVAVGAIALTIVSARTTPIRPTTSSSRARSLTRLTWVSAVLIAVLLHSEGAWKRNTARSVGPFTGWAQIVDDPQPYPGTTRVVLEIEGQRYEHWARGRASRQRVGRWAAGDSVRIGALRSALDPERRARVAWQHVVGTVEIDWVGDRSPATGLAAASNRVRDVIERGSTELRPDQAALFRGLVIGDDADEPFEMLDRFRRSGLSHLTAVSGQNVVFVLAAAGPILRRLRPWPRWALTLGLIGWFVALTRFEPSIVRAGAMAAISATGYVLGRQRSPLRVLAVAVIGLVMIDPLLVRSIGFILSVGATAGVAGVGPWLAARLGRDRPQSLGIAGWLAEPLAVTIGAQVGVAVPSIIVFGRLPLVSIPANLMAVPVAGFVMLYGLPAGILAGAVPATGPFVMFPCRVGVAWVDAVATVAAALEPPEKAALVGWLVVALVVSAALVAKSRRVSDYGTNR